MPLISANQQNSGAQTGASPVSTPATAPTQTTPTQVPVTPVLETNIGTQSAPIAPEQAAQPAMPANSPMDYNNPYNVKEFADPTPATVQETKPSIDTEELDIDSKMGNLAMLQDQIDTITEDGGMSSGSGEIIKSSEEDKNVFDTLLLSSIKLQATDIHITANSRAVLRINGKIQAGSSRVFTPDEVSRFVDVLLATRRDNKIKDKSEIDLNYVVGTRRFRVNIFRQMGNFSISLRVIPEKIMTLEEIGMPEIVKSFGGIPNGLILITGPTGSGKSTTIASMLNLINLTVPKHIVTLEDPIEYVFPKGIGLLEQREFGIDFISWESAIRALLRQDPDIVLIGEIRDLDTIESALKIAETGHLVFATLHTNSAAETINRIIDVFDDSKQEQIRIQLSSVLRAVISQRLVPLNQGGRRAAVEVLISTPGVKNAIRDKKVFQLDNIIQTSSDMGMLSLDQSLAKMVLQGLISKDAAKSFSLNPNQIDILLSR